MPSENFFFSPKFTGKNSSKKIVDFRTLICYISVVKVIVFFLLTMIFTEAASSGGCIYTIALTQSESPFCFKDVNQVIRKLTCECGCGQEIIFKPFHRGRKDIRFCWGHNSRKKWEKLFIEKYCECGCRQEIVYKSYHKYYSVRFISGHNVKGRNNAMFGVNRSGENNPMFGRHHTEKSVEKMRKKRIAYLKSNKNKISNTSIELKMGELLKEITVNYISQHYIKGVGFVDFFLPDYNIIIECDGDYWHTLSGAQEKDLGRDFSSEFLHQYKTVRFWEHEINKFPKMCMKKLFKEIERS